MDDLALDRRKSVRREIRTRVHLFNEDTANYEEAHLRDMSVSGIYLITRRKLSLNQRVRVAVPCEPGEETIKLTGQVVRVGHHRSWGMFSYGCSIVYR